MKKLPAYLLAVIVACLGISRVAAAEDHAQVSTVADVSAIQPGTPFMLGIKIAIDPGFHVYWKNPGDSGLATDVKLTLPDGFKAAELMFPIPSRLEFAGPIINFGYEKEVMLMVRITPPKDLEPGKSIGISGRATWLVCDENNCLPGGGELSVELPVADTATPANADLFKQWEGRLPVREDPSDIAASSNSMAIANGNGEASLSIGWKKVPTDIQYFPGPLKTGDVQNVQLNTAGDATKVSFALKSFKGDEPVTGLLTFTSATGAKVGVEISIPTDAAKK